MRRATAAALVLTLLCFALAVSCGGVTSFTRHFTKQILSFGVRVPGSKGHRMTRRYIAHKLRHYGFHVRLHKLQPFVARFDAHVKMANIVGTFRLPNAKTNNSTLVLSCHYDSKFFRTFKFLGATDSAVSCAMLLSIARLLKSNSQAMQKMVPTVGSVKLIFFDGEEAFGEWSDSDSKYGSRMLAAEWEKDGQLDRIALFVLLDLIGAKNPSFHNHDVHERSHTSHLFARLASIERRLFSDTTTSSSTRASTTTNTGTTTGTTTTRYFNYSDRGPVVEGVDDDHIPFVKRGVPVLHLIPTPFPSVWHTEADNESALDWPTIGRLQRVINVFVLEYLYNKKE